MANITELIKNIRNAIFGKDVRESIAGAIEQCYEDGAKSGNANMEVADARGIYDTLKKRLDNSDNVKADKTVLEAEINTRTNADSNLQNQINGLASGSPLVANSVSEMSNTSKVYVNTTDGHWYWYNGSSWADGGVYQATEVDLNSISEIKLSKELRDKINYEIAEPVVDAVLIESKNKYDSSKSIIGSMNMQGIVTENSESTFLVTDYIKLNKNIICNFSYFNSNYNSRYHLIPNRLVIFDENKKFLEQTTNFPQGENEIANGKTYYSLSEKLFGFIPSVECYIRLQIGKNTQEVMITDGTDKTYEEYYDPYIQRTIKEDVIDLKNLKPELREKISNINNVKIDDLYLFNRCICIGDSLTEGYQYSNDIRKDKSYPTFLKMLTNWIDMENAGQSGITTKGWWDAYKNSYDYKNYDIAFIYLGTNGGLTDTLENDTKILEGQTYENYADTNTGSYCKIIERMLEQNPNIKIILIRWNGTITSNVTQQIAEKYNLETINLLDNLYFDLTDNKYHTDATHYNSLGYLTFAYNIYLHLKKSV